MDGFSCSVKITHNLVDRALVSPKVYLNRGSTRTPPPFKIEAGYEDADKKFAVFDADDKITKANFVSEGSMSYDIGYDKLLVIVWKVVKHGTFSLGEGKNSFFFAVFNKSDIEENWELSLKTLYDDAQDKMFHASTTGRYLELEYSAINASVNFSVRAHMTNDKNAQLVMIIDDPRASNETDPTKRALATAIGMSALFTVVSSLSKMALRHLPTDTQSVEVTIQNYFTDTSLEDPKWSLKQSILFDSVPYEIPAQEERQITFKVPFGYRETRNPLHMTKHSAVFVSYRLKGTDRRLVFVIWWGKKFRCSEPNRYSVSLMTANISPTIIADILKNRDAQNVLTATRYLNYQCKENDFETVKEVNGVRTNVTKIVRMAVAMGDSIASSMVVNIGERKGNKLDRVMPIFQDCYEKKE